MTGLFALILAAADPAMAAAPPPTVEREGATCIVRCAPAHKRDYALVVSGAAGADEY